MLGREITAAEASRHDGIILGALLERFAIDNDVEPSEHEIQAFISEHLVKYKQIQQLAVIDQIPKSASGKILRKDLRNA